MFLDRVWTVTRSVGLRVDMAFDGVTVRVMIALLRTPGPVVIGRRSVWAFSLARPMRPHPHQPVQLARRLLVRLRPVDQGRPLAIAASPKDQTIFGRDTRWSVQETARRASLEPRPEADLFVAAVGSDSRELDSV